MVERRGYRKTWHTSTGWLVLFSLLCRPHLLVDLLESMCLARALRKDEPLRGTIRNMSVGITEASINATSTPARLAAIGCRHQGDIA